jgi:hypothetical protein
MLDAAVVGSERTVQERLHEVERRFAPDEVMAMKDPPDSEVTISSYVRLARITAMTQVGARSRG